MAYRGEGALEAARKVTRMAPFSQSAQVGERRLGDCKGASSATGGTSAESTDFKELSWLDDDDHVLNYMSIVIYNGATLRTGRRSSCVSVVNRLRKTASGCSTSPPSSSGSADSTAWAWPN